MSFSKFPNEILGQIIHDAFMHHGDKTGMSLASTCKRAYAVFAGTKSLLLRELLKKKLDEDEIGSPKDVLTYLFMLLGPGARKGFIPSELQEESTFTQLLAHFSVYQGSGETAATAFLDDSTSPANDGATTDTLQGLLKVYKHANIIKNLTHSRTILTPCQYYLVQPFKLVIDSEVWPVWHAILENDSQINGNYLWNMHLRLYKNIRIQMLVELVNWFPTVHVKNSLFG